jgi:hypothetical protein
LKELHNSIILEQTLYCHETGQTKTSTDHIANINSSRQPGTA